MVQHRSQQLDYSSNMKKNPNFSKLKPQSYSGPSLYSSPLQKVLKAATAEAPVAHHPHFAKVRRLSPVALSIYGHLLEAALFQLGSRQPRKSIFSVGRVTYLQRQRSKEDSVVILYKNFKTAILFLETSKKQPELLLLKNTKGNHCWRGS